MRRTKVSISGSKVEVLAQQAREELSTLLNPKGIVVSRDPNLADDISALGLSEVPSDFEEKRAGVERYQFESRGRDGKPQLVIRLSQYTDRYVITGNSAGEVTDPILHSHTGIGFGAPPGSSAKRQVVDWIKDYVATNLRRNASSGR
ncbi:hypothetical protein HYU13_04710 [Candidatus Woesearchaeota archaeon]|nr:hypothetical protein [Candidatus Woesearchaeota archaeon]